MRSSAESPRSGKDGRPKVPPTPSAPQAANVQPLPPLHHPCPGYGATLCPRPRARWQARKRHAPPTQARDRRRAGVQGRSPRRGYSESPAMLSEGLTCLPKGGCREPLVPAGGTGGVPLSWKTSEGRCGRDSGARQARPSGEGRRRPQQAHPSQIPAPRRGGSLCPTPIALCELLCYSLPMKWAPGPLLFLGACRITYVLGANHRESPCGRGAEGTSLGARPSEEGWDRSECRCKASSLEPSGYATHPRQLRDNSTTAPLHGYATAPRLRGAGGEEKAGTHTIKGRDRSRGSHTTIYI